MQGTCAGNEKTEGGVWCETCCALPMGGVLCFWKCFEVFEDREEQGRPGLACSMPKRN